MLGIVSAPAAEKRSAATNHAFKLRQEQFRQTLVTEDEYSLKQDLKRAMYFYSKGNTGPLEKMLREGRVSPAKVDRAMERIPRIKGRPNPEFKTDLEIALRTLTPEKAIEVWGYMTDHEKKVNRPLIMRKYENAISLGYKSPQHIKRIREEMKEADLLQ